MAFGAALLQLLIIAACGFVIYCACKGIGNGCDDLLLIFGPGLIGGFVIPILGVVPDAIILIVSGTKQSEETDFISVGVGALCGATIATLTLPIAFIILKYGRHGVCGKLEDISITVEPNVTVIAKFMFASAFSYLIVLIPALIYRKEPDPESSERNFELLAFLFSLFGFLVHSIYQLLDSRVRDLRVQKKREVLRRDWKRKYKKGHMKNYAFNRVFKEFSIDGLMHRDNLNQAMHALGMTLSRSDYMELLDLLEEKFGSIPCITSVQFEDLVASYLGVHLEERSEHEGVYFYELNVAQDDDELEASLLGNEEMEVISDTRLKIRACAYLVISSVLILLFSDPMISAIGKFGEIVGINAFFVSFAMTPFVSSAGEILTSLSFARRLTVKDQSLGLGSLYGSVTMNNTLGLAVLTGLVYYRSIPWTFVSETIGIFVVTLVVGLCGFRTQIK